MPWHSVSPVSSASRGLAQSVFALCLLFSAQGHASEVDHPVTVTTGHAHTCTVFALGSVHCAGWNGLGQLGDGTTTDRLKSVPVANLAGVVQADAGYGHTCAVTSTGAVKCWGDNSSGQLGDGTTTQRLKPVTVVGLGGQAVEVTAGAHFTCARLVDGTARCWGYNDSGQLGDGTNTTRLKPVVPIALNGVREISAGQRHACAATYSRFEGFGVVPPPPTWAVECWGENIQGQLGDGTLTQRNKPVRVKSIGQTTSIATGEKHSCAALADGTVHCWGRNTKGQLGDGTSVTRSTPAAVKNLTRITMVSAGGDSTCAVESDNQVWCWGSDSSGQVGNGPASFTPVLLPSRVYVGSDLLGSYGQVSVGSYHACQDWVACWGSNSRGQLGDGTTTNRSSAVVFE